MSIGNGHTNGHALQLLPQHVDDLRKSGLTDEAIRLNGYYSEADPLALGRLLGWRCEYQNGPALVIPYLTINGKPTGFARLKPDRPRPSGGKYESPKRSDGPPYRLYVPQGCTPTALLDPAAPLIVTEGEKKGAAADQHGFATVALSGVWCWHLPRPKNAKGRGYGPRKPIPDLAAIPWAGRPVAIIFDSDGATNPDIGRACWHLAGWLKKQGATVKVATPDVGPPGADGKPGKVGLDDLLVAGGAEALRALLERATDPVRPKDIRPVVVLSVEEHASIAEAVKALAKGDRRLYQRGGQLVRVVRPSKPTGRRFRPSGSLRIEAIPEANLRTRISRHAACVRIEEKDGEQKIVPAHPTGWLVDGVAALSDWPGIRHLEGVIEYPVLRPDGSILDRAGHDRATGLLYRPLGKFPPIAANLTRDDAVRAAAELLDVWCDFPLSAPQDRAGCLSAVLTPLARFAFDGPSPLQEVCGNVRGCGKGLLVDTFALISTGREFARLSYSTSNEEMRKAITSLAVAGETTVLLDNLVGVVGCAALDMALTAVEWQDRLLGGNQFPRLPLRVTWYGTGNNVTYRGDTPRRVLRIRLESKDEKPEERTGFKRPALLAWIREHRPRLLVAALTILSAYCRAGCPDQKLTPWGSFEAWSNLVRGAIVWAGQGDPAQGRLSGVEGGDRDTDALQGLLAGWLELDPEGKGLTASNALKLLADSQRQDSYPTMREVLAETFNLKPGQLPESGRLGYRLRAFCGRRSGQLYFANELDGNRKVARWRVCRACDDEPATAGDAGDGTRRAETAVAVATATDAGDAGHAGDDLSEARNRHSIETRKMEFGAGVNHPPQAPHPPHRGEDGWEEL